MDIVTENIIHIGFKTKEEKNAGRNERYINVIDSF